VICLISLSCKEKKRIEPFSNVILHNDNHITNEYANENFNEGLHLVEYNQFGKAKKFFLRADSAYPNSAVILNALGNTEIRTKDTADAFQAFQDAMEADSSFTKTYINYGTALTYVGNYEEAMRIFNLGLNRYIKYHDDRRFLYFNMACTCIRLNENKKALILLERAREGLSSGMLYDKIVHLEGTIAAIKEPGSDVPQNTKH